MSRRKKIGLALGAIVLVGVGLTAMRRNRASHAGIDVRVTQVARHDLVSTVTVSGRIEPKTAVDVSADITGRITTLAVKEGDEVRKGQFLLQIDPAQYQAAIAREEGNVASSEASLIQSRANRDQAERAWRREQRLSEMGKTLVPAEQLEQAETSYLVAKASYQASEAQLTQARATLQEARENLAKTRLVAPIDGRVVRLTVAEGEVAVPGTYSKETGLLMTIADISTVVAKVKVDETDVVRIAERDSVAVTIDAFPKTTFAGRVTRIRQGVKPSAGNDGGTRAAVNFDVEITLLHTPAGVRPDLSCTARIVVEQRHQALSVPIIALTIRAPETTLVTGEPAPAPGTAPATPAGATAGKADTTGGTSSQEVEGVFTVKNGLATFRPVTVGITGDEYFEIVRGLSEGDTIVAGPYQAIRDLHNGARVNPTDAPIMMEMKPE